MAFVDVCFGAVRGACVAGGACGAGAVRGVAAGAPGALGAPVDADFFFLPGTVTILTFGAGGTGTVAGATNSGDITVASSTRLEAAAVADACCWSSR